MKPMIASAAIALSLALVALVASVHGMIPTSPLEMSFDEVQEYSVLKPAMAELSIELTIMVSTGQLYDNIDYVGRSLDTGKFKGLMQRSMLLIKSLEKVPTTCGAESYEALSKFYSALPKKDDCQRTTRIFDLFNELRREHAKFCLPLYKSYFADLQPTVPRDDWERVQMAFNDLRGEDFHCIKKGDTRPVPDAFAMRESNFRGDCSESALNKIATNVARQVKGTPQWESLKPIDSTRFGISYKKQPKLADSLLDEYLFNPCKSYMEHMADKLTSARFDVFFSDHFESSNVQEKYISGDKAFYQALIFNRFCRSLVRDQENLYKRLRKAWKRSSGSF